MTDDATVRLREVVDPRDPAIEQFGRMQTAVYFAPETLIPSSYIPNLIADTDGPRRNFLLVAERDGRVVGGTLFHWLAAAGSGFSSFMGISREARGQGLARRLHTRRFEMLDAAAGGAGKAPGVFIDVVNPTRMSAADVARERAVGSDPWARRETFGHLGFRQVAIRYEQPFGGPNGGPVTVLDLLYCPRQPADSVATQFVVDTMLDYWSPWLRRAAEYADQLRRRAQGQVNLPLISPVPARHAGED